MNKKNIIVYNDFKFCTPASPRIAAAVMAYYDRFIKKTTDGSYTVLEYVPCLEAGHNEADKLIRRYKTDDKKDQDFVVYNLRAYISKSIDKAKKDRMIKDDKHVQKYITRDIDEKGEFLRYGQHGKKIYFQTYDQQDSTLPTREEAEATLTAYIRERFEKNAFDRECGTRK